MSAPGGRLRGSPVDALTASAGMRLDEGRVGLVASRAGVGKTALLVHFALDALFHGRQVLHVALRDTVDHARAHYDELLRAVLAAGSDRPRPPDAALLVERHRMIHSWHGRAFAPALLVRSLEVLEEAAQFRPALIVIDGYETADALAGHLAALRDLARDRSIAVLISLRADAVPAGLADAFDLALQLRSEPQRVRVELARPPKGDVGVALDPTTLLVLDGAEAPSEREARVPARECTLYAGGAAGAETAFGEQAERWGMHEVNLTFDGHLQARTRGRYELSPKELAMGDVSLAYVSKRLHRTYNDRGGLIRGVLQTIWHMVARSQQVFVVGRIQDDGTVIGGTGWSVELARMWSRDLWVYDQDQNGWYHWDGAAFVPGTPVITAAHVCGTGTRYLDDGGRAAIAELFERSFGGEEAP